MKRALVTGGASPLGEAICRELAGQGLHVIIHAYARTDAAERLARQIGEAGGSAGTLFCDLTDVTSTAAALGSVLSDGVPQIIVHNAGTHADAPLAGMSERQWRDVLDVSLTGFYAITRPVLLPMIATRWGRIVAISSVSAVIGNRGQVNYAAAKAGLIGAVRALSLEVASRGITVNAVAPGIIESPAATAALDRKRIAELVPMKRAGTPAEVGALVGFLVSERAAYISGQTISINGGMA
jgi:3-oxoacyl-[acyl-carrier protein] reductase